MGKNKHGEEEMNPSAFLEHFIQYEASIRDATLEVLGSNLYVDDVLQQVRIIALNLYASRQYDKIVYKTAYFRRIAKLKALDWHIREQKRMQRHRMYADMVNRYLQDEKSEENDLFNLIRAHTVHRRMPSRRWQMFTMSYNGQMSHTEIAGALQLDNIKIVKTQIYMACQKIIRELKK